MTISQNAPLATSHFACTAAGLDPDAVRSFLAGGQAYLPEPRWGPLGQVVFERTYSRLRADGSQETWAETCRRVVLGNLSYAPSGTHLDDEAVELFAAIYSFFVVPGGRHLWVTGTEVAAYRSNCWVSGWEPQLSQHFHFLASRLFEGGGVGSNYSRDLMRVTAPVLSDVTVRFVCRSDHHDYDRIREAADSTLVHEHYGDAILVPDTREGWIDTWSMLIDRSTSDRDSVVAIDLSDLRPQGEPLRTFGGRSSGPAPFVSACREIVRVLRKATGRQLSALEAMEIDHAIASSVVAGGARRSARMSMMHWRDSQIFDFIAAKHDTSKHWSTNISVEVDGRFREALEAGDHHAERVLEAVAAGMAQNGEPGLVDSDAHSADEPVPVRVTNPCGEIALSTNGAAGESCNLGSVNLEASGRDDDMAVWSITLLSRFLLRATLQQHPHAAASAIEDRNRRLGLGPMGVQGWAAAHGARLSDIAHRADLRHKLARFGQVAQNAAFDLADQLSIPRPVKVTAVAPTGTISQLSGTTAGIHPVFARHFIRRVRYSNADPLLQREKSAGYHIVPDVYAENTSVVQYHLRDAILDRYPEHLIEQSDEIGVDAFVDLLEAVQRTFCAPGIGNAISATCSIRPGTDPVVLAGSIRAALGRVKGLTVFPAISRPLSPYEVITKDEWEAAVVGGVGDSNSGECVGGACPIR